MEMETVEREAEQLAVVRNMLPASQAEIADALSEQGIKTGVPGLIRKLRRTGAIVIKREGIYRSGDQCDEHERLVVEHRECSYLATRAATAAAQFPSESLSAVARFAAERRVQLDGALKKDHRRTVLLAQIERRERELEALSA